MLEQISIFCENKLGRIEAVMSALNEAGINLRSMTLADTTDFGILRIIVDDTDAALKILKNNNITASMTKVIGINIPDHPGALHSIINILSSNNISIEYLYSLMSRTSDRPKFADVAIQVSNSDAALKLLKENNVKLVNGADIL